MIRIINNVLFFILIAVPVVGQKKINSEFTIGDTIPNIEIKNIINHKSETIKITDFRGKLLILDFWATWCVPCIASFPKLDSLQKKFSKDLQILPVTYEESKYVFDFLQKMEKINHFLPISVTNDTILSGFFKHTTIPHYVWIDQKGKIIAITGTSEVNEKNILAIQQGKEFHYQLKKDGKKNVNASTILLPSIQLRNDDKTIEFKTVPDSSLLSFSVISKFVEGARAGAFFNDSTSITAQNMSIRFLYQIALLGNKLSGLNSKAIVVEITDSTLYRLITRTNVDGSKLKSDLKTQAWYEENGYCYRLKVPPTLAKKRFEIMLNDLNRYFGASYEIEGHLEDRKTKYLSLSCIEDFKLQSKGGKEEFKRDKFSLKIKNGSMKSFVNALALSLQTYPSIFNETKYFGNLDIELTCDLSSLKSVNQELKKIGLQLLEKEKIMQIGIIKQKPIQPNL